ncbi:unnamed protein product [Cunninghamella echinulata]
MLNSLLFIIYLLLYFITYINGQNTCINTGPHSFSDFTIVQINSALYLTGGNPVSSNIWSLNLTNGLAFNTLFTMD